MPSRALRGSHTGSDVGTYYQGLANKPALLLRPYEQKLIDHIGANFRPEELEIFEAAPGLGLMGATLAAAGYRVHLYEANRICFACIQALKSRDSESVLQGLSVLSGVYPALLSQDELKTPLQRLLIMTNIVSSSVAPVQSAILRQCHEFDFVAMELACFGEHRLTASDRGLLSAEIAGTFNNVATLLDRGGFQTIFFSTPRREMTESTPEGLTWRLSQSAAPLRELDARLTEIERQSSKLWRNAAKPALVEGDSAFIARLAANDFLQHPERELLLRILADCDPGRDSFVEIGCGHGGLTFVLAAMGFHVVAYEGVERRMAVCEGLLEGAADGLSKRVKTRRGYFPDVFVRGEFDLSRRWIAIGTNLVSDFSQKNASRIISALMTFDEVYVDLSKLCFVLRGDNDRRNLRQLLNERRLVPEKLIWSDDNMEIWQCLPRPRNNDISRATLEKTVLTAAAE